MTEDNEEEIEEYVEKRIQENYQVFKRAIVNVCTGFSGGAVFGFKVEPENCESALVKIHVENTKGAYWDYKSDDDYDD